MYNAMNHDRDSRVQAMTETTELVRVASGYGIPSFVIVTVMVFAMCAISHLHKHVALRGSWGYVLKCAREDVSGLSGSFERLYLVM